MSDMHEEDHSGPVKTPAQLLVTVAISFIAPVFIIIGLVYYVTTQNKPAAGADNSPEAVAVRLQKVGIVEVRDANRELKSGEDVYKVQCMACHAVDKKMVGPSYQDVAKKYGGQKDAAANLAKSIKAGGAGKWGPVPMPAQAALSDADALTLATWIR